MDFHYRSRIGCGHVLLTVFLVVELGGLKDGLFRVLG